MAGFVTSLGPLVTRPQLPFRFDVEQARDAEALCKATGADEGRMLHGSPECFLVS